MDFLVDVQEDGKAQITCLRCHWKAPRLAEDWDDAYSEQYVHWVQHQVEYDWFKAWLKLPQPAEYQMAMAL